MTTTDGRLLWIFDHAQLVREEAGRAWFYVIVRDITPLREAQQEPKISEKRCRIVSELSECVIFEHDLVHQGFSLAALPGKVRLHPRTRGSDGRDGGKLRPSR